MKKIFLLAAFFFNVTIQATCPTIEQAILSSDLQALINVCQLHSPISEQDAIRDVNRFIALSDEMIIFWRNQIEINQLNASPSLKFIAGFLGMIGFGGALFASYMDNCFNQDNLAFNAKLSAGLLVSLYLLYKDLSEPNQTQEMLFENYWNSIAIKQIFMQCIKPT